MLTVLLFFKRSLAEDANILQNVCLSLELFHQNGNTHEV